MHDRQDLTTHRTGTAQRLLRTLRDSFILEAGRIRSAAKRTRSRPAAFLATAFAVQFTAIAVTVPIVGAVFDLALRRSGARNLTDRTLSSVLADPVALLLMALAVVIMGATLVVQIAALIAVSSQVRNRDTFSVGGMMHDVARALKSASHPQAPILLVYLLVVVPLTGLGAYSTVTQGIAIPPFVTREFLKAPLSTAAYCAIIALLLYVNARLAYTIPAMLIGRSTPLRAMAMSIRMTRRRTVATLLSVALPIGLGTLVSTVIAAGVSGVASILPGSGSVTTAVLVGCGSALGLAPLVLGMATGLNAIVDETWRVLAPAPHDAESTTQPRSTRRTKRNVLGVAASLIVASTLGTVSATTASAAGSHPIADPVILAHRGDVWGGVENTLSALDAAAAEHPDYVEVDVQESKDGIFVASHDTNLLMMTGRDTNVYDLTAAELGRTQVREHGHTAVIPTMSHYVTRARQLGVKLLIELKVHGHEQGDVARDFLRELDTLGDPEGAIYHSLDPNAVSELKRLRPQLQVGLTIAMSLGGVPDSPADFFVVEQASFTEDFLKDAHKQAKPVYVWTVNDDVRVRELLRLGVDGVVTDIIAKAVRDRDELANGSPPGLAVETALKAIRTFR